MRVPSLHQFLISLAVLPLAGAGQAIAADAPVINKVRFQPASGEAADIVGGTIGGSNQGETYGFEILAEITETPTEGQMNEITFDNSTPYRYVVYRGPDGSRGIIAEVEFYEDSTKLSGDPFGVAGAFSGDTTFDKALDSDPSTYFEAPIIDGAYVGLDLATTDNQIAPPEISPNGGDFDDPQSVAISAADGATIRYTTDGTTPTRASGQTYSGPITVNDGVTSVRAMAYTDNQFNSDLAEATFLIGPDAELNEVSSYHIGNSLSDTFINGALAEVASSAGYQPQVYKFTIPGAPTDWLWDHPSTGFGVSVPGGGSSNNVYNGFPATAPLQHLTTQPFSGHNRSIPNEVEHSGYFYELARQSSPNVQFWLYAQWPNRAFDRGFNDGQRLREVGIDVDAAESWEEACILHMRYFEEVRQRMDDQFGGKPIGIIPTPFAFIRLKHAYENGEIPGFDPSQFHETHWADNGNDIHTNERGKFFVSVVVYCTIYGVPPVNIDVPESSSMLTNEQEEIYKEIAWEAVRNYRWAMIDGWEEFNIWRADQIGVLHGTEEYDWNTDADGDGHTLLYEYAIDGSATDPDQWSPEVQVGATTPEVVFPGLRTSDLFNLEVEFSSDLENWSSADTEGFTVTSEDADEAGFENWTATAPSSLDEYFLRLELTPTP